MKHSPPGTGLAGQKPQNAADSKEHVEISSPVESLLLGQLHKAAVPHTAQRIPPVTETLMMSIGSTLSFPQYVSIICLL